MIIKQEARQLIRKAHLGDENHSETTLKRKYAKEEKQKDKEQ